MAAEQVLPAPKPLNQAPWFAPVRNIVILLVLWEVAGRFHLVADGALPSLTAIVERFWADRADYPAHVWSTLVSSALGFAIGNIVAVAAGILFVLSPLAARLFRGFNVTIFAVPTIAIAPILALTMTGISPRVTLAAMGCYFVTMTATVVGLTQIDLRSADLVRAYGGGKWDVMRFVQLRSALPIILAGLQVAAPNAVLGAILAEFGGGGRWGLGIYLLGSLGRADPPRLWSIGLVATAIAGIAYFIFGLISARVTGASKAVTMTTSLPPAGARTGGQWPSLAVAFGSIAVPLVLWWAFIKLLGVPEMIGKTPWGVIEYLFFLPLSQQAQTRLLDAMGQTLPITIVGTFAGLAAAFALSVSSRLVPNFTRALMPVALFSQTMPLIATIPLFVLLLGRGWLVTLIITISVTFFPAFITLAQGMKMTPRAALDLPKAYGAGAWTELKLVGIPAALPYLFAAARLTVPRALLGVMIAEWLATGKGLGNLLNQSRGYLDYGMIWTVAAASVVLSVALYQIVVLVERRVLANMGMRGSE
ncbi:ABC transporter permease [Pseudaminobacter soli (ex Li et al. 2025)]|uniref:ABC transporter permease n=1 Tax=Pseudaminobacter soli (ex Li et al. 2025) TaxID=1295366 RepID=A0A2P7S3Y4_9HYPH|nr:ABC transporter permease subunit [Mesorhizobium soli]PSJ57144.1 ABC transporter permease [Mesorhizobium soli]